uniref:Uncharacterized protein n=1 Tax=Solanum tuberosum TaxID=4113 RepID=M1B289_SOLTU
MWSQVADLLEQHASLKRELTYLAMILNDKEVEISQLKTQLQKAISKGPGTTVVDGKEVELLRAENKQLLKTNASLVEEVKALNKQIIQAHVVANERMFLLMRTLIPPLSPS